MSGPDSGIDSLELMEHVDMKLPAELAAPAVGLPPGVAELGVDSLTDLLAEVQGQGTTMAEVTGEPLHQHSEAAVHRPPSELEGALAVSVEEGLPTEAPPAEQDRGARDAGRSGRTGSKVGVGY